MRLLLLFLSIVFIAPAMAQEKKAEKKTAKKAEKKKAEPKQEWGRFSSNAKKDMKAIEEKKKARK